jgi:hypothetical protein
MQRKTYLSIAGKRKSIIQNENTLETSSNVLRQNVNIYVMKAEDEMNHCREAK